MPYDRFLIAPFKTGLETDLKPWMIVDDAFTQLNNVYCFRGRVRKRFGSEYTGTGTGTTQQLQSRLAIKIGTIDPVTGILAGNVPGGIYKVGQMFSVENTIFTVYNPAAGVNQMLRTDGSMEAATFN